MYKRLTVSKQKDVKHTYIFDIQLGLLFSPASDNMAVHISEFLPYLWQV